MTVRLALYTAEDWRQPLTFYTDKTLSTPLVLTHPQMDVKLGANLLASLTTTANAAGQLTITAPNTLTITLAHTTTKTWPAPAVLEFDIFDDVGGVREAILKSGEIATTNHVTDMP